MNTLMDNPLRCTECGAEETEIDDLEFDGIDEDTGEIHVTKMTIRCLSCGHVRES